MLVISVVYSGQIALGPITLAGAGLGLILILRWLRGRGVMVYAVLGAGFWLAFLKSGIHPTVAGVLLGLLAPGAPLVGRGVLVNVVGGLYARLRGIRRGRPAHARSGLPRGTAGARMHPWVAFVIMPVFAMANAGVKLEAHAAGNARRPGGGRRPGPG